MPLCLVAAVCAFLRGLESCYSGQSPPALTAQPDVFPVSNFRNLSKQFLMDN